MTWVSYLWSWFCKLQDRHFGKVQCCRIQWIFHKGNALDGLSPSFWVNQVVLLFLSCVRLASKGKRPLFYSTLCKLQKSWKSMWLILVLEASTLEWVEGCQLFFNRMPWFIKGVCVRQKKKIRWWGFLTTQLYMQPISGSLPGIPGQDSILDSPQTLLI